MTNKMYLGVLFCHVLLFSFVLCSPVDMKAKQTQKSIAGHTTQNAPKAEVKSINKEQVQITNNAQTERPTTRKRDVPETLGLRKNYLANDDDFEENRSLDDYDTIQALRAYLDNARTDNSVPDSANDYRYYEDEARRKRTVALEDVFNKPESYYEPDIQLTPEEIQALFNYYQQQRLYNGFPYGRWTDVDNQINLSDVEADSDDDYNDRPDNFFSRLYDQRYQNWANMPRNDKFIPNRQIRGFRGVPRYRVPLYRRAVL